jgi:L-fucose isomerase-like protein
MNSHCSRRCFIRTTSVGLMGLGALAAGLHRISFVANAAAAPGQKVKVGKVYLGNAHPGWPSYAVDLEAEVRKFEDQFDRLGSQFADVEFVEAGLISADQQLSAAKEKLKDVDGILAIHLTLGTGQRIKSLLELNRPIMMFTLPYSGHEWHIVAALQREGKPIEVLPSSDYADLAVAVRPFRAIRRLRDTRILHVSQSPADAGYVKAVKEKFGTEIISILLPELEQAYASANMDEARADAERWIKEAEKVVEPGKEEILKSSRMYVAMKNLLSKHGAAAITMNCLGMGLMDRNMGYPCLGFVRFNNEGRAGVCEADLKSTMTQLIFTYLVGRTGFVTDPVFDIATSSIIHAHCVAATQMLGPDTAPSPYVIRSHLEDNRGASLQVRMPVGHPVCMARLIGTDLMLFSTGTAVDSPFAERACRTKLTMRVENIDKFVENWSCGLHRVVFYGDHTRDVRRFCRFMNIKLLREGVDDLHNVPGLEWESYVHA